MIEARPLPLSRQDLRRSASFPQRVARFAMRAALVRMVVGAGMIAALAAASSLPATAQVLDDPANLARERVPVETAAPDIAQNTGPAALAESLRKLRTRASLLMIVAHPDDEDGGMLTYEVRALGVHAAMLTLTRGEGGQNLQSGDFYDALGLVRTQELLAADRYFGIDQLFGTEADFGFSKTKEETFEKWGHDRVLYDAVRAVRLYRPLVLTSVFIGGPTDGHGHHQVAGEITQEVYNAAGDPKIFPDQIAAGLEPWTPLKVYARVPFSPVNAQGMYDYATGKYVPARFYNYVSKVWTTEEPKANVTIPEGTPDPLLGMNYVQFARKGLALQKTQIGDNVRLAPAGAYDVGYHRYGARTPAKEQEQSFFDGIDTSLAGIAALAPAPAQAELKAGLVHIDSSLAQAQASYDPGHVEAIAPILANALKSFDALISTLQDGKLSRQQTYDALHELHVKRVQCNAALIQALGLSIRGTIAATSSAGAATSLTGPLLTPGQNVPITVTVTNAGKSAVILRKAGDESTVVEPREIAPAASAVGALLASGATQQVDLGYFLLRKGAALTRPPFTRPDIEQAYYDVANPALRNAPLPLTPIVVTAQIDYDGAMIELKRELADHSSAPHPSPVVVVPAISVAVLPSAGVVPLAEKSFPVTVHITSAQAKAASGQLRLQLPEGWASTPAGAAYKLMNAGDSADTTFVVTPSRVTEKPYTMTAVATLDEREYREGFARVGYPALAPAYEYRAATYRAAGVEVKVAPGLKVAYLPGTGDAVQASLQNIGIFAKTISVADVKAGALAAYDAVVLGARVYAAHPELAALNQRLLDYAAQGGVVIVQYNTGPFPPGPYPEDIGATEKVVDERAPVRLLDPKAKVLTTPNRITERDFDGWVEERGHGFMQTWDPRYQAVTETHDPGQDEQKGGLLVAQTGKGAYVYVAFALYRQLPEGVPGAYRLFANLLSLGK